MNKLREEYNEYANERIVNNTPELIMDYQRWLEEKIYEIQNGSVVKVYGYLIYDDSDADEIFVSRSKENLHEQLFDYYLENPEFLEGMTKEAVQAILDKNEGDVEFAWDELSDHPHMSSKYFEEVI